MRVEFNATLDDMVDAQLRAWARSKVARSWRWTSYLWSILVFLGLFMLLPLDLDLRLFFGALSACILAAFHPFVSRAMSKNRLRSYYREQMGSDRPFRVEVELSPEGIRTKQKTGQVSYEWSQIEAVEETADSVYFHARGGIIAVRNRAFDSAESMHQFVEEGKGFLRESHTVPPSELPGSAKTQSESVTTRAHPPGMSRSESAAPLDPTLGQFDPSYISLRDRPALASYGNILIVAAPIVSFAFLLAVLLIVQPEYTRLLWETPSGVKMLTALLPLAGVGELALVGLVLARWSRGEHKAKPSVRIGYALAMVLVLIVFFGPAVAVLLVGPAVIQVQDR